MSWIRRTTAGRGGMCLTLTATSAVVIGLAWAAAPATSPAVKLAAAAKPAGNTAPGTASPGRTAGFVLDHGRYLPVAPPRGLGDLVSSPLGPVGINDSGQVTGSYLDPDGRERGFLLDRNRNKFVQIDVPGAVGTQGQGINNQGQVVGAYSDTGSTGVNGAQLRGFLLDHGRYIRLDYPGAVSSQAGDINDRGQVVGEYQAADGTFHGYLWERGRFRTLPTPGGATGINNRGQITGVAGDVTTTDGYLLDGNRLTTFGAPGAQITVPYDINDRGQIVGGSLTSLADTAPSGFLRSRGRFTVINRPGAVATVLFGINDRGQIAGVGPTAEDLASLPGAAMMP